MLRSVFFQALLAATMLFVFTTMAEATDVLVPHQGRLLDAADQPITGVRDISYSIYDAPAGGTLLWSEMHPSVSVQNGLFDALLGTITPLSSDVFRSPGSGGGGGGGFLARWLEVSVAGVALSPRLRLGAVPYAVTASSMSGDVSTKPGGVSAADEVTALRVVIDASDSESQLAIKQSGTKRFGIGITQPDSPLGTRMVVGDLNRDGLMDLVAAADATSLTLVDSTGSGGSVVSSSVSSGLGLQPLGGSILIHSASAASECKVLSQSTPDSAVTVLSSSDASSRRNRLVLVSGSVGSASRMTADLDGDGVPDNEISQVVLPTTASVAIKTKGTGAEKNRTIGSSCDDSSAVQVFELDDDGDGIVEGRGIISVKSATGSGSMSASSRLSCDPNEDGSQDSEISQVVTPTTSAVAIKTKGTGAEKNRTIGSSCDDSSAVQVFELDDDGDGIVEGRGIISVKSATGSGSMSASSRLSCDPNEDGSQDSEISQVVTPTTSAVAIKTKGTGAEKNRTIGSSCDDSSAVQVFELDDDGDGIVEGRGIISVKSATGSGSMSASSRLSCDPNEDGTQDSEISQVVTPTTSAVAIKTKGTGADANRVLAIQSGATPSDVSIVQSIDDDGDTVPESEISQTVTPTTCGVAIKTKGTGADANRVLSIQSGTSPTDASTVHSIDTNNDGLLDRSVSCAVDDVDAGVVASDGDIQVAMKTHKGGTIKGNITINSGSALRVSLDSDGDGYLDNSLGIGIDATHKIDVVGGAYCDGSNWVNASDRNAKENFKKVDGEELLDKISELDITKWNYKNDKSTEHIGPTAQDFQETFGVGSDGKSISTIDPSGIALAAIKELYAQLKQKDKDHEAELQKRDREYNERLTELKGEIAKLRAEFKKKN